MCNIIFSVLKNKKAYTPDSWSNYKIIYIYSLNFFFIHIPTYTTISYVCQCFFVNIVIFLFPK